MFDSNKFGISYNVSVDDLLDEKRKKQVETRLKLAAAEKLTEQITDGQYYTVRLVPSAIPDQYGARISLTWEIIAVQYRDMVMPRYIEPEIINIPEKRIIKNFLEKLKKREYKWQQRI